MFQLDTPQSRDQAARRMLPVVRSIASRLARRLPRHFPIDDLVGAGHQGLCAAIGRFDPMRGEAFDAYAEKCIRGAMLDELRSVDILSRDRRAQAKRQAAAAATLQGRLGRSPTAEELAKELGITLETLWAWQTAAATRFATTTSEDADGDVVSAIADVDAEAADERLTRLEREEARRAAVSGLPARLQRVLELHYAEGKTLRQIGEELGVSESRVCQLESDAVRRLRAACTSMAA